jgi:probable O-glycosylation ligase (exosortase A-associated)
MCIVYPLAFYFYRAVESSWAKMVSLCLTGMFIVSIVFSGSRGAFVGLVATLIYILYKEKKLLVGLFVLAILAGPAIFLVSDDYKDRISSIGEYETDESVGIRFKLWTAAVYMIADYPIFGVGTGNFPNAYGSTYRAKGSRSLYWSPHNVFIQIITEMGIVGFTIYLLFLYAIFRVNKRTRRLLEPFPDGKAIAYLTRGVDVALIGYIVAGQFITATYYPHVFQFSVWASALYLIARKRVQKTDIEHPVEEVTT